MENKYPIDKLLLREMFNMIRSKEIKNVKIEKYDDKQMPKQLASYILKKVGEKEQ